MISAIVLAGGTSSRLGTPKQLLELDGRPVLQHVLDTARDGGAEEIVVVLGHVAATVAAALQLPPGAHTVVNPDYATGQASSLRAGLAALSPMSDAALVLLGDMPGVRAEDIRAVAAAFLSGAGPIVQACYEGSPGHPVLFARPIWPQLQELQGDTGARDLIKSHPDWVTRVDIAGAIPSDLDTMEDYRRLTELHGS